MPKLLTVCVIASAEGIEQTRQACLEWRRAIRPFGKETVANMLPTPLSPTGAAPATHWACCVTHSQADCDHMQAWIISHNVRVAAESFDQADDSATCKLANRDTWLAAKGLKVVG
jgi:hypothetical protein